MKSLSFLGLFILIGISPFSIAQGPDTSVAANAVPREVRSNTSKPGKAPMQFVVPIVSDHPSQFLSLTVEGTDRMHFPAELAARIFAETVHGLTREVNSTHPVPVHLKLLVTIGGDQNYLEQIYGSGNDAVIALSEWNEAAFSRLLVRAVRSSLLTDQQLDEVARTAVVRARNRVDITELKAR